MKPGTRLQMSTCWSSWSASACSSTQEKTRGRSCGSSRCLPPSAAAQSQTSTTACRRCGCGSSLRCTLWPGSLTNSSSSSSSSSSSRTVCSSPWNEKRFHHLPTSSGHRWRWTWTPVRIRGGRRRWERTQPNGRLDISRRFEDVQHFSSLQQGEYE